MKLKQKLSKSWRKFQCKRGCHDWEYTAVYDKNAPSWDLQFLKVRECKHCGKTEEA